MFTPMDRPDGLVHAAAREDAAVATGAAGVRGASGSAIDRRINDRQHE